MWGAMTLALLLTGCVRADSSPPPIVSLPDLEEYSQEFQTRLADEIEGEALPVCPRDFPIVDCSAWMRAVLDYGRMREQIREASDE